MAFDILSPFLLAPPFDLGGSTPPSPTITSIGPGWYASDDGLLYEYARPHRKPEAETRRFWMDFSALSEIVAGDVLDGTPAVESSDELTITNVDLDIATNRVYADIADGYAGTEYVVTFTTGLLGGPDISRSGRIRV